MHVGPRGRLIDSLSVHRRLAIAAGTAIAALGGIVMACGSQVPCDPGQTDSPTITVANAATGKPLCDATVVVLGQGDAGGCDRAGNGDGGCGYVCPGIGGIDVNTLVTLQVSQTGFQTATATGVHGQFLGCSDSTSVPFDSSQQVSVELQPD